MKTLATILAFLFLASPAFAKTECKASPSPGAHYRLIDSKRCWYQGAGLEKSQLTWRADGQPNRVLSTDVITVRGLAPDLASLERSVDRLTLCGTADWGVCASHFDDRWRFR